MIRDPSDELLTFFKQSLNSLGNVYTEIPPDDVNDFIHLQTLYFTDEGTNNSTEYDCMLTINITTRFRGQGTRKTANTLSTNVLDALIGKDITTQHFKSVSGPFVDTLENETDDTGQFKLIGKLLILNFKIQQIKN